MRQLARLKREARRRATLNGHLLSIGRATEDSYACYCRVCLAPLRCETEPRPDGGIIVGGAVSRRCIVEKFLENRLANR